MIIKPIAYNTKKSNLKVGSCYKLHIAGDEAYYFFKENGKKTLVKDQQVLTLVGIEQSNKGRTFLFKFIANDEILIHKTNTFVFSFICEFEELNDN